MVCPFCVVKAAFHVPARLWSAANSGEFRTANDNVNAAKEAEVRKKALMRIDCFGFWLLAATGHVVCQICDLNNMG